MSDTKKQAALEALQAATRNGVDLHVTDDGLERLRAQASSTTTDKEN